MKSYSQNAEDLIIKKHFGDNTGTVLSLGENDGKTLSNSLLLIESGWSALLVEPSKESFKKLTDLHKDNNKVVCVNVAISDQEGEFEFLESGSHITSEDHSLLSTLKPTEVLRWMGTDTVFTPTVVEAINFNSLLKRSPFKTFEFISIDIEGLDFEVLTQIDLNEIGCKVLCIESNSKDDYKYIDYCLKYGMRLFHKNHENLIFVR
jgi:FkbM family methyltransferase